MIAFVGFLQKRVGSVEPPDGNGKLRDELPTRLMEVETAQLTGSLQPVADGVGVHEQLTCRALHRAATGDESRDRVEQAVAPLGERPVDLVDQLAPRLVVTSQGSFDQERVAGDGAR